MEFGPKEDAKLNCPSCGNEVECISPYYKASDYWQLLSLRNQFTWGVLIVILVVIWWPLGIVGAIALWVYESRKAKNKKLYKCSKCDIGLSYNESLQQKT
jgi:DNA-directed RNA polymerase subunit RPC12/RpoP